MVQRHSPSGLSLHGPPRRTRLLRDVVDSSKIAVDVDANRYTLDIGTFELDSSKFTNDSFKGNVLKIRGVVTRELLANPDCYDDAGNAMYVVAKDGNTTDLTVGRYTGLEAYLCDEFGKESIEVAIYNYSKTSGNFSAKGDSGHVTFGTPAWWVADQLMLKYTVYADFNREAF
ncbi:hypothetical protein C2E23DRAFT_886869 [Lenzites betulinus]|nr:hypothetical protein C2E23DRAFT_886869 [Lenzites betulinus]